MSERPERYSVHSLIDAATADLAQIGSEIENAKLMAQTLRRLYPDDVAFDAEAASNSGHVNQFRTAQRVFEAVAMGASAEHPAGPEMLFSVITQLERFGIARPAEVQALPFDSDHVPEVWAALTAVAARTPETEPPLILDGGEPATVHGLIRSAGEDVRRLGNDPEGAAELVRIMTLVYPDIAFDASHRDTLRHAQQVFADINDEPRAEGQSPMRETMAELANQLRALGVREPAALQRVNVGDAPADEICDALSAAATQEEERLRRGPTVIDRALEGARQGLRLAERAVEPLENANEWVENVSREGGGQRAGFLAATSVLTCGAFVSFQNFSRQYHEKVEHGEASFMDHVAYKGAKMLAFVVGAVAAAEFVNIGYMATIGREEKQSGFEALGQMVSSLGQARA